ncbi:MAG TPA: hypothetical protein VFQ59_02880 [Candidatus Paceibacterota bacterium]|nr:hypothetical protein [Candidatus Paceibacterota bacterium]
MRTIILGIGVLVALFVVIYVVVVAKSANNDWYIVVSPDKKNFWVITTEPHHVVKTRISSFDKVYSQYIKVGNPEHVKLQIVSGVYAYSNKKGGMVESPYQPPK